MIIIWDCHKVKHVRIVLISEGAEKFMVIRGQTRIVIFTQYNLRILPE